MIKESDSEGLRREKKQKGIEEVREITMRKILQVRKKILFPAAKRRYFFRPTLFVLFEKLNFFKGT